MTQDIFSKETKMARTQLNLSDDYTVFIVSLTVSHSLAMDLTEEEQEDLPSSNYDLESLMSQVTVDVDLPKGFILVGLMADTKPNKFGIINTGVIDD